MSHCCDQNSHHIEGSSTGEFRESHNSLWLLRYGLVCRSQAMLSNCWHCLKVLWAEDLTITVSSGTCFGTVANNSGTFGTYTLNVNIWQYFLKYPERILLFFVTTAWVNRHTLPVNPRPQQVGYKYVWILVFIIKSSLHRLDTSMFGCLCLSTKIFLTQGQMVSYLSYPLNSLATQACLDVCVDQQNLPYTGHQMVCYLSCPLNTLWPTHKGK